MNGLKPTPAFLERMLSGTANVKTRRGKRYARYDRIAITRDGDKLSVLFFDGEYAIASMPAFTVFDGCTLNLGNLRGRLELSSTAV